MDHLGATMAISAGALGALMVAAWLVSLPLKDVSYVDVLWGPNFVLVGWIAYAVGGGDDTRALIAAALASLWGLRLAVYIGRRKAGEGQEDRRYAEMRERDPRRFPYVALLKIFLLQGAMAWVVSLPLQGVGAGTDGAGALLVAGTVVWAVGLAFEAVGDAQLARFKADPATRGKVMDRGLWRYTRHPNYFGDATVWWGLYLIALDAGAWWSFPGPVIMTFLLTRGTGKEMTEKHMSRREGYADYVERTSGFVPLPPRSKLARAS